MPPPLSRSPRGAWYIIVADQDPTVVAFIVDLLRRDGHAVFPAYDAGAAARVARSLDLCDLVISNTCVTGVEGIDMIADLRRDRPQLPILYLADPARSTPEMEAKLPPDVPVLRLPFTADELRASVDALLSRPRM